MTKLIIIIGRHWRQRPYIFCTSSDMGISPIMTSNTTPKFTEEAVSYGQTTGDHETIPVVEDSKCGPEGMDTIDSRTADSGKQLGKNSMGRRKTKSRTRRE